jgi:hypothetical protein
MPTTNGTADPDEERWLVGLAATTAGLPTVEGAADVTDRRRALAGAGLLVLTAGALLARRLFGRNVGTPERFAAPMFVGPNVHSSTSPCFGASLIAPSWL